MRVTSIRIDHTRQNSLVGFATIVIDDLYLVSSLAIHRTTAGGFRIVYPSKRIGTRQLKTFLPLNHYTRQAIETAIIEFYRRDKND